MFFQASIKPTNGLQKHHKSSFLSGGMSVLSEVFSELFHNFIISKSFFFCNSTENNKLFWPWEKNTTWYHLILEVGSIHGMSGCCAFYNTSFTLSLLLRHPIGSNSLWSHGLQHARPPCPSPSPKVCPSSCPLHQWCHPAISSSNTLFSFCPQSFPASGTFPMSLSIHSYLGAKALCSTDRPQIYTFSKQPDASAQPSSSHPPSIGKRV